MADLSFAESSPDFSLIDASGQRLIFDSGSRIPISLERESLVGSHVSFDWTSAVTGSILWIPASDKRVRITDILCSGSDASLVTLYFDANNISNRVFKASLVAGGGFITNFSKPFIGPTNGSLFVTTTPSSTGFITVNGYER